MNIQMGNKNNETPEISNFFRELKADVEKGYLVKSNLAVRYKRNYLGHLIDYLKSLFGSETSAKADKVANAALKYAMSQKSITKADREVVKSFLEALKKKTKNVGYQKEIDGVIQNLVRLTVHPKKAMPRSEVRKETLIPSKKKEEIKPDFPDPKVNVKPMKPAAPKGEPRAVIAPPSPKAEDKLSTSPLQETPLKASLASTAPSTPSQVVSTPLIEPFLVPSPPASQTDALEKPSMSALPAEEPKVPVPPPLEEDEISKSPAFKGKPETLSTAAKPQAKPTQKPKGHELPPEIRKVIKGSGNVNLSQGDLNAFAPSVSTPPVGIPNVVNSCYMNSCLQNFFAHPQLLEKFFTEDFSKEGIKNNPRYQRDLARIEKNQGKLAAERKIAAISKLVEEIKALYFELMISGDKPELLKQRANALRVAIFESGLNIDLSNKKDILKQQDADAFISVLFDLIDQGVSLETTIFSDNGVFSNAPKQSFNASLSLSVVGRSPSLQQLIANEFNHQQTDPLNKIRFSITPDEAQKYINKGAKLLDGANLTRDKKNEEINGTPKDPVQVPVVVDEGKGVLSIYLPRVKEQTKIQNPPKVLAIQLKRFSFDPQTRKATKNTSPVSINENSLDLTSFVQGGKKTMYRLTGMVHHLGGESINSGHYVSSVKKGDTWHRCSDDRITENSQDNPDEAYLLFFTLED